MIKTIEIDLDTQKKLKNLKIRPDESLSTRCEITWFNFDTVLKRFHALLHDFIWIKKCIPQVISFQLLSSVVGRLAVYGYDWEPLSEEFLKELEEIEKEEPINSEDVEEFMDNLCDDNVEE